jgi:pSer/pThr/pTyr-binding forkhead associated (FHA) protein
VDTLVGESPAARPPAPAVGSIPGRLVVQSLNISIPIPSGKQVVVIGREDPVSGVFPDIDLDLHGGHEAGVGRRHAQLVLQGGQVLLEDLDSVNGTVVNKVKLLPNKPQPLQHGDEVRFGKMVLIYMGK